jgi:hypothetical protein
MRACALSKEVILDTLSIIAKYFYNNSYIPTGRNDSGGRWYPSDKEICSCCKSIRQPSREYPWSLWMHCRTLKHIKNILLEHPGCITDAPEALKMTKESAPQYINSESNLLIYVRDELLGVHKESNKGVKPCK